MKLKHETVPRLARLPDSLSQRLLAALLCLIAVPLLIGARFRTSPCCAVIGVDTARGLATIRDNKTGRTWQFEAGAATLGALKIGAQVEADLPAGRTISIGGVERAYALNEPDPS